MLTHGGDNAEAYFSYDNKNASFQSNNSKWGLKCDQIFNLDINKAEKDSTYKPKMISCGKGRTTCSYFLKDNKHILYASTHKGATIVHLCLKRKANIYGLYINHLIFI